MTKEKQGMGGYGVPYKLFLVLRAASVSYILMICPLMSECYSSIIFISVQIVFPIKSLSRNLTQEKSNYDKVKIYTYEDVH